MAPIDRPFVHVLGRCDDHRRRRRPVVPRGRYERHARPSSPAVFDVKGVNMFLQNDYKIPDSELNGVFRSQVFKSKGNNDVIYAYLYQVMAPKDITIREFSVLPFEGHVMARFGDMTTNSIYVNGGVGPGNNAIGGFEVPGDTAPSDVVFQPGPPATTALFKFNKEIPAGKTSYIVGVFSTLAPELATSLKIEGDKVDPKFAYATPKVPEPPSLVTAGSALLLAAGAWRRRRLGAAFAA